MARKRELLVVMKGAPDDLLRALDRAKRGFSNFGSQLKAVGTTLSTALTLPIAAAGVAMVKTAGDFEASMNRIQGLTQATGDSFDKMKQLALDLGASTKFSAGEAALALENLLKAGLSVDDAMSALPGTLNLAAAGNLALGDAAKIAAETLKAFKLPASEMANVTEILAKGASGSTASVSEMGQAFSKVAPVAAGFGVSIEETGAAITILAQNALKGEVAGTALKSAIANLADDTSTTSKELAKMGIATRDGSRNLRSLADIIEDLEGQADPAAAAIRAFGLEAGPKIVALVNQGSGSLRDLTANMGEVEGVADRLAKSNMKGLNGALEQLGGALETLAIRVADAGLLKFLTDLANKAADMVGKFSQTNPELLKWGTVIAAAVAAIGPLLIAIGAMASGLSSITAVLAGTSGAFKAFMAAVAGVPALLAGIKSAATGLVATLGAALPAAVAGVKTALAGALAAVGGFSGALAILGKAASATAAVFIGWELGTWLAKNIPLVRAFGDAVAGLVAKIPGLVSTLSGASAAQDSLAFTTAQLEQALAEKGVTIERGSMTTAEYAEALAEAGRQAGVIKTSAEGAAGAAEELTEAEREAAAMVERFERAVGGAVASTDKATGAVERYTGALDPLTPAAIRASAGVDKLNQSWRDMVTALFGQQDPNQALKNLKTSLDSLLGSFTPVTDGMRRLVESFTPIDLAVEPAVASMYDWEIALRDAGVESKRVAEEDLEALRQKLELVRAAYDAGKVSLETLNGVQQEYNKALGITTERKSAVADLGRQVSTIMTDLSRSMADAILGAQELGEAFVNAMKAIATAILRTVVEGAMDVLLDSLKSNTAAVGGLIDKFKDFFGMFGGGGGGPSVPSPGGEPGVPGGGGGGGGGMLGVIDTVTGIVNAIVSIFNAFTLKRIEKDVARVEVTTRGMLNEALNRRDDAWAQHNDIMAKWDMGLSAWRATLEELKKGLGVNLSGGNLSFKFPPEIAEHLADILAESRLANGTLTKIKEWSNAIFLEQQITSGLLRQMVANLGSITTVEAQGPLAAAGGTVNLNFNLTEQANPRETARQIGRELERLGANRSGAEALNFNFGG